MTPRHTILLVDDDAEFLEMLQALLRASEQDWEIVGAQTTILALTMLSAHKVDLAVLDLRMPGVDGLQFLELIGRTYPQLRKMVLSGHVDEGFRASVNNAGADLVLEKPVALEQFQNIVSVITELLRNNQPKAASRRMSVEDVIQVECMSRHSLILDVTAPAAAGRVYIQKGNLVHAEYGEETGERALLLLLTSNGEFHYDTYAEPPQQTLHGSWEFLLKEAGFSRDQAAELGGEFRAAETAAPSAAPEVQEMVVCRSDGEVLHAWQAADAAERAAALAALWQVSEALGKTLPLGALEHVEFYGGAERLVARFSAPGMLLVRGTVDHG